MLRRVLLLLATAALAVVTTTGVSQAASRPLVVGGGTAQECDFSGLDCTFDFGTGITSDPDGSNVRGAFTVASFFYGTTFTAEAVCLDVVGNKAGIIGREIHSTGLLPFLFPYILVYAEDNVATGMADGFQPVSGSGPMPCPPPPHDLTNVLRGNVTVSGETIP